MTALCDSVLGSGAANDRPGEILQAPYSGKRLARASRHGQDAFVMRTLPILHSGKLKVEGGSTSTRVLREPVRWGISLDQPLHHCLRKLQRLDADLNSAPHPIKVVDMLSNSQFLPLALLP